MVNMLNLWWICSIYGEHASSDIMIGLALKNYPKMTLWMSKSIHWILRQNDIYFEFIWCPNLSTESKDTVIFILKSADLYSHSWLYLTTGLAMKNYPKRTLWMSMRMEHAQFMVNMLNLCWFCSIYGKHAQFMVNMLNLWWPCSIYGEHA